jgi:hypothetical protein
MFQNSDTLFRDTEVFLLTNIIHIIYKVSSKIMGSYETDLNWHYSCITLMKHSSTILKRNEN